MNSPATKPEPHPQFKIGRVGVLLVNLGTPDAPTAPAVRKYLAEFLSDPRVVEIPKAVWLPILHGVILNTRPAKTAKAYGSIWDQASGLSPLRLFTKQQAERLRAQSSGYTIDWAMRYGNPSIASKINELKLSGHDRILIVPLYPQYSASTTGSVHDAVFAAVQSMRWHPAIRTAPAFHDEAAYIEALASVTQRHLTKNTWNPDNIILSFHGIPERYVTAGDPYLCHCTKTARLLREKMGWSEKFSPLAFQSKFGRDKWLEPSTTSKIDELRSNGVENLAVITPGFVSDCIETLEEIDIEAREQFIQAGGKNFTTIPCLNAEPEMIELLGGLVKRELGGWVR